MTPPSPQELGFVVIGRNEGERLAACLRSLLPLQAPIVYADSGSTDGSPDRAAELGATVVRLDPARAMNASRGRHEGYQALKVDHPSLRFVQFLDGDCVLAERWIDEASAFLEQHQRAAVVCGRRFEAHPDASFYNKLCDEEWNTPCGRVASSGGDALMRVSALDQVGDFDPSLMASEEPELAARLREADWEIWRIDALMTEHDAKIFTFKAYWRRAMRAGFGYAQAWMRTAKLSHRINGRLLASSLFWMAILPLGLIVLAALLRHPTLLVLLPLIYFLQIARMAASIEIGDPYQWRKAFVIFAIKSGELIGAARAIFGGQSRTAIDYKGN